MITNYVSFLECALISGGFNDMLSMVNDTIDYPLPVPEFIDDDWRLSWDGFCVDRTHDGYAFAYESIYGIIVEHRKDYNEIVNVAREHLERIYGH